MVEVEIVEDDSFEKTAKALKAEVFAEGVLKKHKTIKDKVELKNLVRGRYAVSDANYVWCSDWTIGQGGTLYILLILDMSSKLIISSSILDREPKGSDIVLTLLKGIQTYGEKPKVFHTDCGGAYMSKELENFLKEKNIKHSHRDKSDSSFDNQVIENLNRKLWDTLQKTGWLDNQTKRKRFIAAQHEDINYVLNSVIEKINLDKPGNWIEGNPRELYDRLVDHPYNYEMMARKGSPEANWIDTYKEYLVVQGQAEDLTKNLQEEHDTFDPLLDQFQKEFDNTGNLKQINIVKLLERARSFRTLMVQMNSFFQTSFSHLGMQQINTSKALKVFQEEVENSNRLLQEKETYTGEVIEKLSNEIKLLRETSERKEREAEKRKERRLKRNRKPLRDAFHLEDLKGILRLMGSKPNSGSTAAARDRVCIVFLFITGIRVAELKELTLSDIENYYNGQIIDIEIGKSTSRIKQQLVPSEETRNLIKKYIINDIELLCKSWGRGSYLCSLSREHLTRRLNDEMREYGKQVNKELTSHSCRISYVTRYVEKFGIDVARQMVGHVNISTTQNYSRSMLTARQKAGFTNAVLASERKDGRKMNTGVSLDTVSDILEEAEV